MGKKLRFQGLNIRQGMYALHVAIGVRSYKELLGRCYQLSRHMAHMRMSNIMNGLNDYSSS